MAIARTIDAPTFANNVDVTSGNGTVTKNAADTVAEGDVLELGGVAFVRTVTSTTSIELHKAYAGSTNNALSGAVRRTPPKSVREFVVKGGDSNTDWEMIFVDSTEKDVASTNLVVSLVLVGGYTDRTLMYRVEPVIRQNVSHSFTQLPMVR